MRNLLHRHSRSAVYYYYYESLAERGVKQNGKKREIELGDFQVPQILWPKQRPNGKVCDVDWAAMTRCKCLQRGCWNKAWACFCCPLPVCFLHRPSQSLKESISTGTAPTHLIDSVDWRYKATAIYEIGSQLVETFTKVTYPSPDLQQDK